MIELWAVKGPDGEYVHGSFCTGAIAESYTRSLAARWQAMKGGEYKHVRVRITEVPND